MSGCPSFILSSGCLFTSGLELCARVAGKSGFDGLELILNDPGMLDTDYLHKACGEVKIYSLHAPFRSWGRWGGHLRAWQKTANLAQNLGDPINITLHPPVLSLKQIPHFWWFTKSKDLSQDLGSTVPLSLENLPLAGETTGMEGDAWTAHLKLCAKRKTNLTMDICHLGVNRMDILDCLKRTPRDILANIHFSDCRGIQEHMWPGSGELDMDRFLSYLARIGYTGLITLEIGPDQLPDGEEAITDKLKEYLEWIKGFFPSAGCDF